MVQRALVVVAVIANAGCAAPAPPACPTTAPLQARIDRLEAKLAALEAPRTKAAGLACEKVIDTSFAVDTTFQHSVPFEQGSTRFDSGDRIVIREVRGTRPELEEGGIYLVKGEYTLASSDQADLSLYVTAKKRGQGCTSGNDRGTVVAARGSGEFALATPLPYDGYPHVTFYVKGQNAGGVYFGSGDFLKK